MVEPAIPRCFRERAVEVDNSGQVCSLPCTWLTNLCQILSISLVRFRRLQALSPIVCWGAPLLLVLWNYTILRPVRSSPPDQLLSWYNWLRSAWLDGVFLLGVLLETLGHCVFSFPGFNRFALQRTFHNKLLRYAYEVSPAGAGKQPIRKETCTEWTNRSSADNIPPLRFGSQFTIDDVQPESTLSSSSTPDCPVQHWQPPNDYFHATERRQERLYLSHAAHRRHHREIVDLDGDPMPSVGVSASRTGSVAARRIRITPAVVPRTILGNFGYPTASGTLQDTAFPPQDPARRI